MILSSASPAAFPAAALSAASSGNPPAALDLPGVWRAGEGLTDSGPVRAVSSGHPLLDAELPAGGWPAGLTELLSDQPGMSEALLLAPMWPWDGCGAERRAAPVTGPMTAPMTGPVTAGTRSRRAASPRPPPPWIAWVVPERLAWVPHAPGWRHLGIDLADLLWVRTASSADAVWSIEQLLRGRAVRSVVWVAPQVSPLQLRRVHWAGRSTVIPVFAARPLSCRQDPSPAPLRLTLRPRRAAPQGLEVGIFKRPGPLPEAPLVLPYPMPGGSVAPVPTLFPAPYPPLPHAVDRAASAEAAV
jgi:protein ImuA